MWEQPPVIGYKVILIDHYVIVRGMKVVSRYDYNQEYRDKILNHKN